VLVCVFAVGALLSRSMESLEIVHKMGFLKLILTLLGLCALGLWILGGFCAAFSAVLRPDLRRLMAWLVFASGSALLGYAGAIALAPAIDERLSYGNDQAVEALIAEFDPVVHAIRRFEVDHGRAPEGLLELVPRYLPRIPRPEVLDTPIELRYDRLGRDWRLEGEAYLMHGLASMCPLAEIAYLRSQDYAHGVSSAGTGLEEYDHSFRGWRWYIID